jgi:hypothetical protein
MWFDKKDPVTGSGWCYVLPADVEPETVVDALIGHAEDLTYLVHRSSCGDHWVLLSARRTTRRRSRPCAIACSTWAARSCK